jgi:hypothetical protein
MFNHLLLGADPRSGRLPVLRVLRSALLLSRPPKGYDPTLPMIEDLKRKDFVGGTQFTRKEVCSAEFMDLFSGACAAASPFMKFLTEAMNLKW